MGDRSHILHAIWVTTGGEPANKLMSVSSSRAFREMTYGCSSEALQLQPFGLSLQRGTLGDICVMKSQSTRSFPRSVVKAGLLCQTFSAMIPAAFQSPAPVFVSDLLNLLVLQEKAFSFCGCSSQSSVLPKLHNGNQCCNFHCEHPVIHHLKAAAICMFV